MNNPIVECVPNFSEGRNMSVIKQITDAIESVEGVSLLNVDPGEATNRTVVTFVGSPEAVVEAAFRATKKAGEVIDMRKHHGAHPRMGATDVLPLIPVSGITLEECAELARQLAKRIADEAGIPCYCYEASAFRPERKNLAVCRAGEYEALASKLTSPTLLPDFMPPGLGTPPPARTESGMPASTVPQPYIPESIMRTGISVVGARDFLIAVNFNLNTKDETIATAIAREVREKGYQGRPGTLKATKAIGWYIDEYGIAQVSMNLCNISLTPLHAAFCEVSRHACKHGVSVTGTEIIGLVPLRALTEAGHYFLQKRGPNPDTTEESLVTEAIASMNLCDLRPFNPNEKVIEYLLRNEDI